MTPKELKQLFRTGVTVSTPGAIAALQENYGDEWEDYGWQFLLRHVTGDWGDLCDDDLYANTLAVKHGERILSAYLLKDGTKLWVITEADRSATTFLLPGEY